MLRDLNTLRPGDQGRVAALNLSAEACRSLRRMGLTEGTAIRCLRFCPLGGPVLYRVRGIVLALRREDGGRISVRIDDGQQRFGNEQTKTK